MWSPSYKHTHIQSLLSGYGKHTMRAWSVKLIWSLDLNFSYHITLFKMQQMERTKVKNFKHARGFSGCCSPTSLQAEIPTDESLQQRNILWVVKMGWGTDLGKVLALVIHPLSSSCFNKWLFCLVNAGLQCFIPAFIAVSPKYKRLYFFVVVVVKEVLYWRKHKRWK